jgi:hypothetical protein
MRFLAFTLALCGFCFAQNDRPETHQVSTGNCSINASNVRGSFKVSFSGSACNGLSGSMENLVLELVELLRSDLDARGATTPYRPSPALAGCAISPLTGIQADYGMPSKFPTIGGSDNITLASLNKGLVAYPMASANSIILGADYVPPSKILSELSASIADIGLPHLAGNSPIGTTWDSGRLLVTNTPEGITPSVPGKDHSLLFGSISDLTATVHTIGLQPSASLVLTGSSILGATLGSNYPFTKISADASSIATAADHQFVFHTIADLTANEHIGPPPSSGLVFPGNSVAGAPLAFGCPFTNKVGSNSILTGADHPLVPIGIADLTACDQIIGLQSPAGLVAGGDAAIPSKWDSISLTFTNISGGTNASDTDASRPLVFNAISQLTTGDHIMGLKATADLIVTGNWAPGATSVSGYPFSNSSGSSSSVMAGADYASLSKSLSDITSSGHVITGWIVTYLPAESR